MDVAFVTTRLVDRDAQGNFSAATLAALKEKCGKVALFTFAFERAPIEGVEVRFVGGRNGHGIGANLGALLRTFSLAKALAGYDLLVLAGPDLGVLPAVHLAKRRNPKLRLAWVYHSLTPPEFLPSARDRLLTRLRKAGYLSSMRRSDLVQTFSQYVKEELTDAGIPEAKIVPLPFGVEVRKFGAGDRQAIRDRHGLGANFVMLYVGRLAPAKRVDRLIAAAGELKTVPLVIVGGGPEQERLEALAKASGARVIFAGRVPDGELPDYYAACDVWVTASEHEGFCVPIVEAMAAGRPVVVPAAAAMPETAGEGGLAYAAADPAALVRSVDALRKDEALYRRLAAAAARRARAYDLDAIMDGYLARICGGRP